MVACLIGCIGGLICYSVELLVDSSFICLFDCVSLWLVKLLFRWLFDCCVWGFLFEMFIGSVVDLLHGCLFDWCSLSGCSIGCLSCLIGYVGDLLVGWLIGWRVDVLTC